jgi:hypothetical protein
VADWIYTLESWQPAMLAVVASFIVFSLVGLIATKGLVGRLLGDEWEKNDVVGAFLGAIGVFYGIALGLIAVASWQAYSDIDNRVAEEAATMSALRTDVKALPGADTLALLRPLYEYADYTIHCAWPAMAKKRPAGIAGAEAPTDSALIRDGQLFIKPFRDLLYSYQPQSLGPANVHAAALHEFNDLIRLRRIRLHSVAHRMPAALWWVVLLGGVLTLAVSWLFQIQGARSMHVALNTVLATVVGLLIYMIAAMDQPFRGPLRLEAKAFEEIQARAHEEMERHPTLTSEWIEQRCTGPAPKVAGRSEDRPIVSPRN